MTGLLRHVKGSILPLESNIQYTFAKQAALVHYPTGSIYTFIPKNGCTALRYSLAIANGLIEGPKDLPWIHQNNAAFAATLKDLACATYSFVVLRCPYRRLVSAFLDKIVSKTPEAWALRAEVGSLWEIDDLTFRGFIEILERPKLRISNMHWRAQADFLVYQEYTDWFCLERFDRLIERLSDEMNFAVHDTRTISRHGTYGLTAVEGQSFADTPVRELAELRFKGKVPAYHCMFDQELRDRVKKYFAGDLGLYRTKIGADELLFS